MLNIIKQQYAWAINNGDTGLLGRYWWFGNESPHPMKPQHEGCPVSLFKTKREALVALRSDKAQAYVAYPKAKVVKVQLTISVK